MNLREFETRECSSFTLDSRRVRNTANLWSENRDFIRIKSSPGKTMKETRLIKLWDRFLQELTKILGLLYFPDSSKQIDFSDEHASILGQGGAEISFESSKCKDNKWWEIKSKNFLTLPIFKWTNAMLTLRKIRRKLELLRGCLIWANGGTREESLHHF